MVDGVNYNFKIENGMGKWENGRMGKWKMIERYEDGSAHLYDLSEDVSELTDLSKVHPEQVAKMRKKLHQWYKEVDAKFLQPKGKEGKKPWRP